MAFAISDYIPKQLLEEIKRHLRARGNTAQHDYLDNHADEDSVTGALARSLRRRPTQRYIDGRFWNWSVSSKKFVGKGPRAQEPVIGADAIVEFSLTNAAGQTITKSLLFQAKKDGSQQSLVGQVEKMEQIANGCSAIIDYSDDAYRALDGADYLRARAAGKRLAPQRKGDKLGDYLADEFMGCRVGVAGMSYDAVSRELRIPEDRVGALGVPATIRDRIRITTAGPVQFLES